MGYTGKVSLSGPGTFSVKNKNGQTIHSGVQEVTFTNYPLPITITCTNKIYGATSSVVSITGDYTAQITDDYSVDAKIYTAKFTVNFYRYNGGDLLKSQTVLYGNNATAPTATRTGYTFTGWSGAFTNVTSDITVYGQWTANSYTVTLNAAGGSNGTGSVTATYGSSMPSATMPTRIGYTFGGYYTGQNGGGTQYYNASGSSAKAWDIASATTLYAKWTGNQYTVTLDNNGGTGGSSSVTAIYGSAMPAISLPSRTGYTFKGYYTTKVPSQGVQFYNSNGTSARAWNIAKARTLYAYWTPNTYAVTLNQQSGSGGTSSVTATYGSEMPSITKPTRTGYTFGGYFTGTNGTGTQYYTAAGASARSWNLNSNTTLYAKWTGKTYAITVDPCGGTFRGSTNVQTYPTSGTGSKTLVTGSSGNGGYVIHEAARVGYTLVGYYDAKTGGNIVYNANGLSVAGTYWTGSGSSAIFNGLSSATATALTVYAHWSANTYTLTLNDAGGSGGSGSATVKYGKKPGAVAVPAREGYVFRGYYTGANGTGTRVYSSIGYAYSEWTTAGNATLYAYWLKVVHLTVNAACSDNGGVIPPVAGTPLVRIGNGEPGATASADVVEGQTVRIYAGDASGLTLSHFGSAQWDTTVQPQEGGFIDYTIPGGFDGIAVTAYYDRNLVNATVALGGGLAASDANVQIVPGDVTRRVGDTATFSISDIATGYSFYGWGTGPDAPQEPVSDSASYAVTLSGDIALYAHCAREVSVECGEGGTVAVSVLGENVETPSNPFKVPVGSTFRIVSTPNEGYLFTGIKFTETGGSTAVDTQYGADAVISPTAGGEYAVSFSTIPPKVYLACLDVREGDSGVAGTTSAAYDGTEQDAFEPVDVSEVDDEIKNGVVGATWYKVRQGLSVRLSARRSEAEGYLEWKKTENIALPLPSGFSLMGATPVEASAQGEESWTDRDFTVSGDVLVKTTWGVYASPKVTLVPTDGGRAVFKGVDPVGGQDVHEKEFPADGGGYQTTTVKAIPAGGYVFAGWYRGVSLVADTEERTFEVRADVTLEARFRRDDNAVFVWEGGSTNKVMEWTSGVMTMPRPGDPVAVRVDATGYPVDASVRTYSSPEVDGGQMHDVAVSRQDARRLPRMRPERFWQVSVRADVEIDAVVVATNIVEAN